MTAPKGWTVLGSGPLADGIRAELERDPERYRPETWSIKPVGHCPCCDDDVYRCTTQHTGWTEGFATLSSKVHPRLDAKTGLEDPDGTSVGCCCVPPNFSAAHTQRRRKRNAKRRRK